MRRRVGLVVAALTLLAANAQSILWTTGAAATGTTSTGVIVSGPIPVLSNPLIDNTHHRVFVTGPDRVISFSFALGDRRSLLIGRGVSFPFISPSDRALFVVKRATSGFRLLRIDPVSLRQTGNWAEPRVVTLSNVVWTRGLFWSVVERPSIGAHCRYVLASLDPNHPGQGWHNRLRSQCLPSAYLVASPQGHWLACVDTPNVFMFHIAPGGAATLTSSDAIADFENGPSFSADGQTALLDASSQDPVTGFAQDGFFAAAVPNLATPTQQWITAENYTLAAFTQNDRWIVAFDGYGYTQFFDPSNELATPVNGAYIPLTNRVVSVVLPPTTAAFPANRPYLFVAVIEDISDSSGTGLTYHLARYPEPAA